MDWLDYREKLGIGFNDAEKFLLFKNKTLNLLSSKSFFYSNEEHFNFCLVTGTRLPSANELICFHGDPNFTHCIDVLSKKNTMNEFLAFYIAFLSTMNNLEGNYAKRKDFFELIQYCLQSSQIDFEIYKDADGVFIFPKGAKELDKALVSEVLDWLQNYPQAHKTFTNALKQYSDGSYPRDIADNFRKALEEFFQEFLGNTKNLSNNKTEIGKYLKDNNADSAIYNMIESLINSYDKLNNEIAKHNDKVDEKFLEFLLYQTGIFMRLLITLRKLEGK